MKDVLPGNVIYTVYLSHLSKCHHFIVRKWTRQFRNTTIYLLSRVNIRQARLEIRTVQNSQTFNSLIV